MTARTHIVRMVIDKAIFQDYFVIQFNEYTNAIIGIVCALSRGLPALQAIGQ